MPTGVGIQARKLLTGLHKTGKYDIVSIAGSLTSQRPQPILFENIKIYPTSDGYGNPNITRAVIALEKPDIVVAFSDPRFFSYLFMMDDEFRGKSKLILYHTWDNEPFPKYNLPWYASCDDLVMISKFSYDLMSKNGVGCHCIPHGVDPSEFFTVSSDIRRAEREALCVQAGFKGKIDFIIFWNNRNITRKRPGDVIHIFKEFCKKYPKSMLLMNTVPVDREGTDLTAVTYDTERSDSPIVFSFQRISSERLNIFYNISDVTLNIAYNEGFGLCVTESLAAGTPVIATKTGGMTEQMTDGDDTFGWLLDASVRELFGVPGSPYIFRDFVSYESVWGALEEAYALKKDGSLKGIGQRGREFILRNNHVDFAVSKWDAFLQYTLQKPSSYKRWKFNIL
jgi:glycosyltransferase involved in cell wall biosynthesis